MHHNQIELENKILSYWKESNVFQKSNDIREGKPFVFYDGPPFATGNPHYGHILVSIIKDVIARYHNMLGSKVPRQFGWDCHGLPVESLAQKKLNISAYTVLKENKVSEFNDACRSLIDQCADQWEETISKIGRWVDFENSYKTMDKSYMESVWWAFKQIYNQDRIYKSYRIMPYSGKLMTALSNFESDNYLEVEDPYVIVEFKSQFEDQELNILVYTTTPWTLPTNAALCINPENKYSIINVNGKYYLLATNLIPSLFEHFNIIETNKGSFYKDLQYTPLFSVSNHTYKIVCDNYVSEDTGTGVVHIAPAFGEEDYNVGKINNLPLLDFLDEECNFDGTLGLTNFCKDEDNTIIEMLKGTSNVFKYGKIKHSYPYCDRTNTPLIFRAIESWYLKIEDIKDKLLENNKQIKWVPESVGSQRFANWLSDARDWNISRNRLWGSCIPIWIAEDGEQICVGSIAELEDISGQKVSDLHKEFIDKIIITKDGKTFKRTPEILDCWFESGAMPFARLHYPFENKEIFEQSFPADFVVEGLDQTRGWFYTLLILSTIIFDKQPFKNVIVNGLILASDNQKMSKSKGNYTDPNELINQTGADPLRIYLCSSAATHAEPLRFENKKLEEASKSLILPFKNAVEFYKLYANDWKSTNKKPIRLLDNWILSKLSVLIKDIRNDLDNYEIYRCIPKIIEFVDSLCNWYIRLSRKVFWGELNDEKESALNTLYFVLNTLMKISAPFIPFTAESFYKTIENNGSVHWQTFPISEKFDSDLISNMGAARHIANLGLSLRKEVGIKVRQPLPKLMIFGSSIDKSFANIIADELNVISIEFLDNIDYTLSTKANYKTLGKKCGKSVEAVAFVIKKLSSEMIEYLKFSNIDILGFDISYSDVIVSKSIKTEFPSTSDKDITVILDTSLTDNLIELGFIAEIRSIIQSMRKEKEFELTDKIDINIYSDICRAETIYKYLTSLKTELLAENIQLLSLSSDKKIATRFIIKDNNIKQSDELSNDELIFIEVKNNS